MRCDWDPGDEHRASECDRKRRPDWETDGGLVPRLLKDLGMVNSGHISRAILGHDVLDSKYPRVQLESRNTQIVRNIELVESTP